MPNKMLVPCLQLLLVAATLAQRIVVPKPDGPHDVSIRTSQLIDTSRVDDDDPKRGHRRIMVSVYSPTTHAHPDCSSPYALDKVAAAFSDEIKRATNVSLDLNRLVLPICSVDVTYGPSSFCKEEMNTDKPSKNGHFPLVFFSTGLGLSRFFYNEISSWLASRGFIVIAIDHPYTTDVVQFPDNTTATYDTNTNPDQPTLDKWGKVRADDASFTLDQLSHNNTAAKLLFLPEARPLSLRKVGIWGHSFGGATAAATMNQDERFAGGIDLDGALYGPVVQAGLNRPFILWQREEGHNRSSDPSWATFWPKLTGFKRNLGLIGAAHLGFTDLKLVADLYGLNGTAVGISSLDGKRTVKILDDYAKDFFNFVLKGGQPGLVQQPSHSYPEVTFIP